MPGMGVWMDLYGVSQPFTFADAVYLISVIISFSVLVSAFVMTMFHDGIRSSVPRWVYLIAGPGLLYAMLVKYSVFIFIGIHFLLICNYFQGSYDLY